MDLVSRISNPHLHNLELDDPKVSTNESLAKQVGFPQSNNHNSYNVSYQPFNVHNT